MPRHKSSWKRKFRGNKYTRISGSDSTNQLASDSSLLSAVSEDPSPSTNEVRPNPEVSQPRPSPVSSSKKKLSYLPEFIDNITDTEVNVIVNLGIISKLIQEFVKCKYCGEANSVILDEDRSCRKGLATKLCLECNVQLCLAYQT